MLKSFWNPSGLAREQKRLLVLVLGAFLPFYFTVPLLFAVFFWVLSDGQRRKTLLAYKYGRRIPVFCGFTAVVALCFLNWFGLICSLGFYIILSLHLTVRHYGDAKFREAALRLVCLLGGICGGATLVDFGARVVVFKTPMALYRCQLWFFNPNYLATMLVAGVLCCAFLLMTAQVSKKHGMPCLVLQLVGIYFTGSVFAFVALAVGLCGLLLFVRRLRLWVIVLLLLGAALAMCAVVPLVLARWNEMDDTLRFRLDIWQAALEDIRRNFLFGRGFFGYFQLSLQDLSLYQTTHAHNLIIDSVLNYGLVGCGLLLTVFVPYFKGVWRQWRKGSAYGGFLLAALCALLAHSVVDMTMLWVQTGLLCAVLMGCIGNQEDEVN